MYFHDRFDAGRHLAEKLAHYRDQKNVIVLALPRGGVPVAYEVAKALEAPLDVFLVRKLGLPGHEELAMGAVANGNVEVLNDDVVQPLQVPREIIDNVVRRERRRLQEQREFYRDDLPSPKIKDRIVILVDDGLATGSTMKAAVAALGKQQPKRLVVAVPVGAAETCDALRPIVGEVVCGIRPEHFYSVGTWYDDFSPTSDQMVQALLEEAAHGQQTVSGKS